MGLYGLNAKMVARETKGNQLTRILLKAADLMKKVEGCHMYVVGQDVQNPDVVMVFEVWESKEVHDKSLSFEGVTELISEAIPLLDQPPVGGVEFLIQGGLGLNYQSSL